MFVCAFFTFRCVVCMCVCVCFCMCMRVYVFGCTVFVCVLAYVCRCICACSYVYICACAYVRSVYVCVCLTQAYTYIYTKIHRKKIFLKLLGNIWYENIVSLLKETFDGVSRTLWDAGGEHHLEERELVLFDVYYPQGDDLV